MSKSRTVRISEDVARRLSGIDPVPGVALRKVLDAVGTPPLCPVHRKPMELSKGRWVCFEDAQPDNPREGRVCGRAQGITRERDGLRYRDCECGGTMYEYDPSRVYRDAESKIVFRCTKCHKMEPV